MGGFGSGHGSGGKREGSGRPASVLASPRENIMIRVSSKEKEMFKRRAAQAGLSVTEFIKMRCISGEDEPNEHA